jgi:hypothetical protein
MDNRIVAPNHSKQDAARKNQSTMALKPWTKVWWGLNTVSQTDRILTDFVNQTGASAVAVSRPVEGGQLGAASGESISARN